MRVTIKPSARWGCLNGENLQTLNKQNKMAEWTAQISERKSSGQSVKNWCKENGVLLTFKNIYRKYEVLFKNVTAGHIEQPIV